MRLPALLLACLVATAPTFAQSRHAYTRPGVLRIGVVRDIDSLDPLISGQAGVADIAQFIFSGLIRYDDRGNAIPDVATEVPTPANGGVSRDGRTITYHLRKNVRFSDGSPLTANDVVFTWHAILNPNNNVPYHFPYDLADRVTAPDPYTVVAHLRAPSAPFLAGFMHDGLQGAIVPQHVLAGLHDVNHAPFNLKPVGSGPFMVESYQPGVGITFVPNPYYFGGKPKLGRIDYRIMPNENSLQVSLQTHEIDMYWGAAEPQYRLLRTLDGITVSAMPSYQFEQLAFNTRRAPFSDLTVRRAAAYAIDWDALSRNIYLAVDLPGVNDIFPGSWASDPSVKRYPHDIEKARALLDAAGWKPGSDGIRVKNGQRLAVDICTVAGVITRANAEVFIQQELRDAGFDVQVRNSPASALFSSYGAGGIFATGKFDLGIYAWTKIPDPDDTETIGPDRVPPNGANYSGLVVRRIGALQVAGAQLYDRNARRPFYLQLQRRIELLLPYQTMVWRANIDAYNSDLHGFRPAPAVSDFWNAQDWSI
jgi:peptide/nickel transport system substrate-binding protein